MLAVVRSTAPGPGGQASGSTHGRQLVSSTRRLTVSDKSSQSEVAVSNERRAAMVARAEQEPDGPQKGGELNAAITSALVGIHTEYLGRGPRRASTFHYGHVLVTLMHDVLTPAEKALIRTNQTDAVAHIRHLFQQTMAPAFREAVERLTGRKVLAFISGNHLDPDVAAELFILDAPL